MRTILLGSLLAAAAPPALAEPQAAGDHRGAQEGHGGHGAGAHGGGDAAEVHRMHRDPEAYIAAMESKERDAWQKPDQLLAALGVAPGQRVADIGAGPGYFTRRLARRVGPAGWVYAVDVEPRMLQALHGRLAADGARTVTTVLSPPGDPMLPDATLDLVLLVDSYHHLSDRPRYLARLGRALRPGGRVAVVDFHKRPLPVGPPPEMKVTPEEVVADAAKAGLRPLPGPPPDLLPHQYVLLFAPAAAKK